VTRALRRFGRFWLDFVVGDDWRIAVGVAVVVAAAGLAAHDRVVRAHVLAVSTAVAVFAIAGLGLALEAGARRPDRVDNGDAAPSRAAPALHGEHAGDDLGRD
jgi:hypothetical protein